MEAIEIASAEATEAAGAVETGGAVGGQICLAVSTRWNWRGGSGDEDDVRVASGG